MKVTTAAVTFLFFLNIEAVTFKSSLAERLKDVISASNTRPTIFIIFPRKKGSRTLWSNKLRNLGVYQHKKGKLQKGGIGADYYDLDVGRSMDKVDYDAGFPVLRQSSCGDLNGECIRYCLADKYCQSSSNIVRCTQLCPEECMKMVKCGKEPITF